MTAHEPSEARSATRRLREHANKLRRAATAYRAERNLFSLGHGIDPGTGLELHDATALLEAILNAIVIHPTVERAGLVAFDRATGEPRVVEQLSSTGEVVTRDPAEERHMSTGILETVRDQGTSLYVTRMVDNPQFGGRASVKALQLETVFVAPIGTDPAAPPAGALYALSHERRKGFPLPLCNGIEAATAILRPLLADEEGDPGPRPDPTAPYRRGGRFAPMVGSSRQMARVLRSMAHIVDAWSRRAVLLIGASGTGKNLAAHCLVSHSQRADGPFHELQLATMEPDLAERLLFGCVETGVRGDLEIDGLLRRTRGGTLFLDGIEAASPSTQARLVQLLEDGTYRRGGRDTAARRADVWLLAATNANLRQEMEAGRFRKDLYFQLQGQTVSLPPLRRRAGDIPLLARYFALETCEELDLPATHLSPGLIDALRDMPWPGNVRQLRELVRAMVDLTGGGPLSLRALARAMTGRGNEADPWRLPALDTRTRGQQRVVLVTLMQSWGPSLADVARRLGIQPSTLERMLQRLGLESLGDGGDAG